MNILYLEWPCYCGDDAKIYFRRKNYKVTTFEHEDYSRRISEEFIADFAKELGKKAYDFAFSFNFFPILAEACHIHGLPYVCIVFDSPYSKLYSETAFYDTNYIFHFDSFEVEQLKEAGVKNIYHTLLPVLQDKLPFFLTQDYDVQDYACDISFMGCLYNEEYNLYDELCNEAYKLNGKLDDIVIKQMFDYRHAVMRDSLRGSAGNSLLDSIQEVLNFTPSYKSFETLTYVVENYVLARKVTSLERVTALSRLGEEFSDVVLYTRDADYKITGVDNRGPADYFMDMPYVFYHSRINLNMSSRSIHSGIPLRCIDVMGSGGFLLSNYQTDLVTEFEPGRDLVCFDGLSDMIEKAKYYLKHEEERIKIAQHGCKTAAQKCSYDSVFKKIFSTMF